MKLWVTCCMAKRMGDPCECECEQEFDTFVPNGDGDFVGEEE